MRDRAPKSDWKVPKVNSRVIHVISELTLLRSPDLCQVGIRQDSEDQPLPEPRQSQHGLHKRLGPQGSDHPEPGGADSPC